ncbi:MAG TPA: hypothetical protein VJ546_08690 [Bacillales bacterium]|nr:hypothetical protein [Bacillales bacterium]
MITFLLIISFLLNGVAIFSILILFTRQNRLLEMGKRQEKMKKEVEEIISASLFEMKEENEAFIHRFQEISSQPTDSISPSALLSQEKNEDAYTPQHKAEPLRTEIIKKTGKALKKQAVKAYQNSSSNNVDNILPINVTTEDVMTNKAGIPNSKNEIESEMTQDEIYRELLFNQVEILKRQGFTTAEIAKKLGRGMTEIELLQKFGQNH